MLQVPHEPLVGRPAALCRKAAPGSPSVRRTGRSKVGGLPALANVTRRLAAFGDLHPALCPRSSAAYLESC